MRASSHEISTLALTLMGSQVLESLSETSIGFIANASRSLKAFYYPNKEQIAICITLLLIGAILPDIDKANTKISKKLKGFYIPFIGHRTYTHAIYIPCGLLLLSGIYSPLKYLALGYFLHLVEDSMSKSGTKPFYPLSFRCALKLYRTGKLSERLVTLIIVIGALLTIYLNPDLLSIWGFQV